VRTYIRIVVSVALLTLIFWRIEWSDVGRHFAGLDLTLWLAAVGLYVLAQVASARRWQLYANELGFEQTLPQFCAYSFIGMFFSLFLPTLIGGDVLRVWYLNGSSGRKWPAIASVVLERINGLLVLIAAACVGVLISPVELPAWLVASVWSIAGCAGIGVAFTPILRRWQRLPLERRCQIEAFQVMLRSPRLLIESTLMSIVVQIAAVLILWCLGIGLGLDVPIAYYFVLVPMVSLLMLLPISVNGMGVREGATVLLLLPLGVDESAALALAFLWFSTGVAISVVGGVVYLFGSLPGRNSLTQRRKGAKRETLSTTAAGSPIPAKSHLV
jgi:uncharacterized membrane protein YbhN (UPF0104 family)